MESRALGHIVTPKQIHELMSNRLTCGATSVTSHREHDTDRRMVTGCFQLSPRLLGARRQYDNVAQPLGPTAVLIK